MLNLVANIASVIIAVVLGFFFTPFLIHKLGPASYAMLPIATTIIAYFSIFSQVTGAAISRQLSLAVNGKHEHSVATVFLSVGKASRVLGLFLIPAIAGAAFAAPLILSTPQGKDLEVGLLIIAAGINLLTNLFAIRDSAMLVAKNAIYVDAFSTIIQTVLRIGLATALMLIFEPQLWFVAAALVIGSVIAKTYRSRFVSTKFPETRDQDSRYEPSVVRSASFTSAGVGIGRTSNLILLSSDLIIVNLLFGATEAGIYAAALQMALLLRLAATSISQPFTPTVLNRYTADEVEGAVGAAKSSVRAVGLILAIPTGLLLGANSVFMAAWLGPEFAPYGNYLIAMLILIPATASAQPLFAIILGADRNKVSGIATLIFGLLHIVAGYVLAVPMGLGPIGIAISATSVIAMKNLIFIPLFVARICNVRARVFLVEFLPPLIAVFVTAAVTYATITMTRADSLFELSLVFAPLAILSSLLGFAMIRKSDRAIAHQHLRNAMNLMRNLPKTFHKN